MRLLFICTVCLLLAACGYIEEGNLLLAPGTSGATANGFLLTSKGVTISDGSLAHDFGSLPTNSSSACSFTLANDSIIELELGDIGISDCDSFSLALTNPGSLASGTDFSFEVRFHPCLATNLQATVWLSNTDNTAALLSFSVCGTGVDNSGPVISSLSPTNNSHVDDSLASVEISFSEPVQGADNSANYVLSGSGKGSLSVVSVDTLGGNSYRLNLGGSPGDEAFTITLNNITDSRGNALTGNTITYLGWWDTAWARRRKLTFDNSGQGENLVDFPVLVRLDASRIAYDSTQDAGQDIRFVDSDGSAVLKHQIERWDESGTSIVWVKVPQVDGSSDSDFVWLYYGNNSVGDGQDGNNVWDSNFFLVWHLADAPPSNGSDSTGNGWESLPQNMTAPNLEAAAFGMGQRLNGSNQWIDVNSPNPGFFHDVLNEKTFEAWIKTDNTMTRQTIYEEGGGTNGWMLGIFNNLIRVICRSGGAGSQKEVSFTYDDTSAFYYVVGVFDNGTMHIYFNGEHRGSIATGYASIGSHSGEPGFGRSPDGDCDGESDNYFSGLMDEIRLSTVPRSADWIKAQYLSMSDTFITYGAIQ